MDKIMSLVLIGMGGVIMTIGICWRIAATTIIKEVNTDKYQQWQFYIYPNNSRNAVGQLRVQTVNTEDIFPVAQQVTKLIGKNIKIEK